MDRENYYIDVNNYNDVTDEDVFMYVDSLDSSSFIPDITVELWDGKSGINEMNPDYIKSEVLGFEEIPLYIIKHDNNIVRLALNNPELAKQDYINIKVNEAISIKCLQYFEQYLKQEEPKEGDEI